MKMNIIRTLTIGVLFITSFGFSNISQASQVEILGRTYSNSCSYYTNRAADLVVRYKNKNLPWGTTVKLIYGWGGFEYIWTDVGSQKKDLTWTETWALDMPATEAYTWTAVIQDKNLHVRGSPRFLNKFEFVIAIRLPNGEEIYEKGSRTSMGYYEVNLGLTASCLTPGSRKPEFQELGLTAIEK